MGDYKIIEGKCGYVVYDEFDNDCGSFEDFDDAEAWAEELREIDAKEKQEEGL